MRISSVFRLWLLMTLGGVLVTGLIRLFWPGEDVQLSRALIPATIILILIAFARLGPSSLGDDSHVSGGEFSSRLSRQHRGGLARDFQEGGSTWMRRSGPGLAAIAALVTLWLIATVLFLFAGVE